MTIFHGLLGSVYIFENTEAKRIKVGLSDIGLNTFSDRLRDVNEMWLGKKVTCQICGGKLVNTGGYVPHHVKSGAPCLGGRDLPMEKDVSLAESYLESIKINHGDLAGNNTGIDTRVIKNIERRINRYRFYTPPVGRWEWKVVFYTEYADRVESLTHKILKEHLDTSAPFGEVFTCSVIEAMNRPGFPRHFQAS